MVEEMTARTASMDSMMNPGRLKKKPERSKTPRVVRSFCAFDAFSSTGRKTWSALIAASAIVSHRITYYYHKMVPFNWSRKGLDA